MIFVENRMKENPEEGDAGNSCKGEVPEQNWLSLKRDEKPATPLADRNYPDQVHSKADPRYS